VNFAVEVGVIGSSIIDVEVEGGNELQDTDTKINEHVVRKRIILSIKATPRFSDCSDKEWFCPNHFDINSL
jgi:hypothetical protein